MILVDEPEPEEVAARVAESLRTEWGLGQSLERFPDGSVPVYAAGTEHVIKLFPQGQCASFETEKAALARIAGSLSIPTPRVLATGEREGWSYVVMSRLRGRSLAQSWATLAEPDRLRLLGALGIALAELHAVTIDDLTPLALDWQMFIDAQRAACREKQRAKELTSPWLDQIDRFLARWTPPDDGRRALLHTEVMREHLLVEQRAGHWTLSGLVDFEPAVIGAPEYELGAVGVFATCGQPTLMRAFLDGYGASFDDEMPFRVMAYKLLHRYSNLRWYIARLGTGEARDLEALAREWFGARP